MALQEAVNQARLRAWAAQPASFTCVPAIIDADATIVPTGAEAKAGIDIAYNGVWGYSAVMVSFANTKEPLYFALHGANRPSHEGVVPLYERAISLCRQAGFAEVVLRGDTDRASWHDNRPGGGDVLESRHCPTAAPSQAPSAWPQSGCLERRATLRRSLSVAVPSFCGECLHTEPFAVGAVPSVMVRISRRVAPRQIAITGVP